MIRTQRAGDVVTLRLDRPAVLNAIDGDAAEALHAALLDASGKARCIVLAGGERAFCSGADLSRGEDDAAGERDTDSPPATQDMQDRPAVRDMDNRPATRDMGARLESSFNPLMRALRDCRVPVISAVRGAAAGIGASIALACDMIVAGESAYFLQAFRRVGLVPDGGAAFLLAHAVGRVRAMELMLLGERLPAPIALAWGLISRVVPDDAVEREAAELAERLAAGPTLALGLIRQAAWAALSTDWTTQLDLERRLQRDAGASPDFAEGVAAFRTRREARFSGL